MPAALVGRRASDASKIVCWLEGRVVGETRGWHTSRQRTLGEGSKLVCAIQERLAGPREATVLEDWVKLMWLELEAMA